MASNAGKKAEKTDHAARVTDIITTDEFAGLGGSFVLDPATGKRSKVEGTKTAADQAAEQTLKGNSNA